MTDLREVQTQKQLVEITKELHDDEVALNTYRLALEVESRLYREEQGWTVLTVQSEVRPQLFTGPFAAAVLIMVNGYPS